MALNNDLMEIRAEYVGDPIQIGNTYSIDDVIVTVYHYSGRKYEIRSGFYVGNTMVNHLGVNIFYAFYRGLQAYFYVRGVESIDRIVGTRTAESKLTKSDPVKSGTDITHEDIDAYVMNKDGTGKQLKNDQFTVNNSPVLSDGITVNMYPDENGRLQKYSKYCEYSKVGITHDNKYESAKGSIIVPTEYKFLSMTAWYEGLPVPEDKRPSFDDIVIQMDTHSGKTIRIPNDFYGIMFERLGILDNLHIIKVTYTAPDNSYKLAATVHVPICRSSIQTGNPFRCLYVKDNGEEVDLSDFFYDKFRIPDTDDIYITWQKFLNTAEYLNREGRYILDAPIHTGLDHRYDQRWLVTITLNPSALKANIIKNL